MAHVWISLAQDEDGYPPFTEEQLHTREVGTDRHEVLSVPAFAKGIAVGDILATKSVGEELWATHVESEGKRWCVRIVALGGFDDERIVEVFDSMGALATKTPYGVVTLDVGPDVDAQHLLAELESGLTEGNWDYDVGVMPTAG